jgi:ferredoxin-nitrite reductase
MLEYKKLRKNDEAFELFFDRVLKNYTNAKVGFIMMLQAYLRSKNIEVDLGYETKVMTGKNEEFEVFELGRKLYYKLTKKEAYSSYERFTNVIKSEKLEDPRKLLPNIDENIALMLESILNSKEERRAVVFSEIMPLIMLYTK